MRYICTKCWERYDEMPKESSRYEIWGMDYTDERNSWECTRCGGDLVSENEVACYCIADGRDERVIWSEICDIEEFIKDRFGDGIEYELDDDEIAHIGDIEIYELE